MHGERMNEYYDLWRWGKFYLWILQLGRDQGMRLDQVEGHVEIDDDFVREAINCGRERDSHAWVNGDAFNFDERAIKQVMQEEKNLHNDGDIQMHVIPNLDENFDGYCALQSVEKNKEGFTKRQVQQADVARSVYHILGAPDSKLFNLAIWGNFLKIVP